MTIKEAIKLAGKQYQIVQFVIYDMLFINYIANANTLENRLNSSVVIASTEKRYSYANHKYIFKIILANDFDTENFWTIFPILEQMYDDIKAKPRYTTDAYSDIINTQVICEYDAATKQMHMYANAETKQLAGTFIWIS